MKHTSDLFLIKTILDLFLTDATLKWLLFSELKKYLLNLLDGYILFILVASQVPYSGPCVWEVICPFLSLFSFLIIFPLFAHPLLIFPHFLLHQFISLFLQIIFFPQKTANYPKMEFLVIFPEVSQGSYMSWWTIFKKMSVLTKSSFI